MTANQNGFVLIKKPWATFPLNSINKNQLPCLTLSVETGELFIWFYNLFWGAKVTVQMRVLSAPTFFSIKK